MDHFGDFSQSVFVGLKNVILHGVRRSGHSASTRFGVWLNRYQVRTKILAYNLDPQGKAGAFELLLQKYLCLAEFTISLATGSIVLLIGSSVLHGKDGRLPGFYASPLVVPAASVLTGILFIVFLILNYEDVQHGNPHTVSHD